MVLIATGPLILGILGPGYAEHGTTLIRMMALTLPSVALMTVYTALARLRRRLRLAVTAQILLGTTVVLGVIFTTPRWGLNAVGYSYLAAELLCTIILVGPVVAQLRKIAAHRTNRAPRRRRPRAPIDRNRRRSPTSSTPRSPSASARWRAPTPSAWRCARQRGPHLRCAAHRRDAVDGGTDRKRRHP